MRWQIALVHAAAHAALVAALATAALPDAPQTTELVRSLVQDRLGLADLDPTTAAAVAAFTLVLLLHIPALLQATPVTTPMVGSALLTLTWGLLPYARLPWATPILEQDIQPAIMPGAVGILGAAIVAHACAAHVHTGRERVAALAAEHKVPTPPLARTLVAWALATGVALALLTLTLPADLPRPPFPAAVLVAAIALALLGLTLRRR